jgi:hypothetical protein
MELFKPQETNTEALAKMLEMATQIATLVAPGQEDNKIVTVMDGIKGILAEAAPMVAGAFNRGGAQQQQNTEVKDEDKDADKQPQITTKDINKENTKNLIEILIFLTKAIDVNGDAQQQATYAIGYIQGKSPTIAEEISKTKDADEFIASLKSATTTGQVKEFIDKFIIAATTEYGKKLMNFVITALKG